jgi:hypothetical protein
MNQKERLMKFFNSIMLLILTFSINANAGEFGEDKCEDLQHQDIVIENSAMSADDWDFKSNVCEELLFHQVAESYRNISIAYENISMACKHSKYYVEDSFEDLKQAKKSLDEVQIPNDIKFEDELCSSFDLFLTSIDAL